MRTTIDIPDPLLVRVKRVAAERKTTVRMLMLDALERSLDQKAEPFQLRDAAVGGGDEVDAGAINDAIDQQRDFAFIP